MNAGLSARDIDLVPSQGEVVCIDIAGASGRDDLPIELKGNAECYIYIAGKISGYRTSSAKRGIEAANVAITSDCKPGNT